ncbi:Lipoprotein [Azospirillaceae bacterium]
MVDAVPSAGSLMSQVSGLQQSIQAALQKVQQQNDPTAANKAAPSGEVTTYRKDVNKSSVNVKSFSTDVGILIKDTTRLNVVGGLAANDPADFFKFRVTSKGETFLGHVGDDGIRIQLMDNYGVVKADSNEKSGEAFENYKQLQEGGYELDRGEYTIRVSRDPDMDTDLKTGYHYALQLRQGDYKQDYDTVANQPKAGESPFNLPVGTQNLAGMLATSVETLKSLPAIGTSATDKLYSAMQGSLFNGVY